MLFKRPLKVRLVGKSASSATSAISLPWRVGPELDASVDQEGVGCHAVMLFERADQVGR
jgi:hypothetical protein